MTVVNMGMCGQWGSFCVAKALSRKNKCERQCRSVLWTDPNGRLAVKQVTDRNQAAYAAACLSCIRLCSSQLVSMRITKVAWLIIWRLKSCSALRGTMHGPAAHR